MTLAVVIAAGTAFSGEGLLALRTVDRGENRPGEGSLGQERLGTHRRPPSALGRKFGEGQDFDGCKCVQVEESRIVGAVDMANLVLTLKAERDLLECIYR